MSADLSPFELISGMILSDEVYTRIGAAIADGTMERYTRVTSQRESIDDEQCSTPLTPQKRLVPGDHRRVHGDRGDRREARQIRLRTLLTIGEPSSKDYLLPRTPRLTVEWPVHRVQVRHRHHLVGVFVDHAARIGGKKLDPTNVIPIEHLQVSLCERDEILG